MRRRPRQPQRSSSSWTTFSAIGSWCKSWREPGRFRSCRTAGAFGLLNLSQSGERPGPSSRGTREQHREFATPSCAPVPASARRRQTHRSQDDPIAQHVIFERQQPCPMHLPPPPTTEIRQNRPTKSKKVQVSASGMCLYFVGMVVTLVKSGGRTLPGVCPLMWQLPAVTTGLPL
jgi:hypothetical protein